MERGLELEVTARAMYSLERGVEVEEVGFIEYSEFVGGSPDGFVGDDGIIEIKSHSDTIHFRFLIERKIDSKYMAQCQMLMLISGRKWVDHIAYNPNFKQSLIITRIEPDPIMHAKLLEGFKVGEEKIKSILNQLQ
jgi:hypothetical protein